MYHNHVTIMSDEIINMLNCNNKKIIVDGTLGNFGHASHISKTIKPNGVLIGIDQDIDAIKNAHKIINKKNILKTHIIHGNFTNISNILKKINITTVDGIIIDNGLSLHHIKTSYRGFSFSGNEPLDMRMNINNNITARDILKNANQKKLTQIFDLCGENNFSHKIVKHLINIRKVFPIKTNIQLKNLIQQIIPKFKNHKTTHPVTRIFMGLRIAVNQELKALNQFLESALTLLNPGGRLCVLSFHSLEDRIVKNKFNFFANPCICPKDLPICGCKNKPTGKIITKKAVCPSKKEINNNPMSRSAKLRVIEKL